MGYIPSVEAQLDNALGTIENLRNRIAELEAALREIIALGDIDATDIARRALRVPINDKS